MQEYILHQQYMNYAKFYEERENATRSTQITHRRRYQKDYTEKDHDTGAMKPTRVHFREGLPDDCISFQMGRMEPDLDAIPYIPWSAIPDGEKRDLEAFFARIYPDPVLCKYVLTLLASCLEGQNKEQKFYVNQGEGSNGKSMIQTPEAKALVPKEFQLAGVCARFSPAHEGGTLMMRSTLFVSLG
jgi:phage/plasmid-associated DNA primase